jgi:rhodanese-related sulfurtransferase
MKKVAAILVSAIAAMGIATAAEAEFPDISIKELDKAIKDKKVVVIDVNGSSSYKKGHVPTAIDFAAHKKDLAKVLPEDKKVLVVAYCGGPTCSAYKSAATAAKELGYENVKHLSAGISGWMQAEMAVEKGEKSGDPEKSAKQG